ncbi:MAG TPA: NAD-dependent epimerase/dehydratase family protein [Candidatus Deferrimicrobiaceae bacterium]|nr:NAD-dependent epimerase/dehydratase family protein [Candidatus Deferrimicrobiaceae bacterium]
MKILVTGGAGFIGSHVVDAFLAAGHEVAVADNLTTGDARWINPRARFHEVDLRSARLARVFEAERPEVVAHLAAQASVARSVTDPAFDASVNVGGGIGLLECCRRYGVRRVIYSSSGGAGYGDTDVIPTPESHPSLPISPYGITKVTMEHYVNAWSGIYGIGGVSLRYANIYGPRQNPQGEAGVIAIFCHRLLTGQIPMINGDGAQTRDYTYVEDVAAANLKALEHPEVAGPVNISTGVETSVNDLYRALVAAAGSKVRAQHAPARPGEQRRSCLSPTLAGRVLGWKPTVTLEEGLRRTFEFFQKETVR